MPHKRVVVIEGEDASPEAMGPTIEMIDQLGLDLEWLYPPVGNKGEELYGTTFPDEARKVIDKSDTTLFGATSGKSTRALFYLRWGKDTFANVRPSRWIPGYRSPLADPKGIDLVIVRENLEDLYLMTEGDLEDLKALNLQSRTRQMPINDMGRGRYAVKVITESETERVARFSFELAGRRKEQGSPGKVTVACKYNMLPASDGFFREITERISASYPHIEFESMIIDNFAHNLSVRPQDFDVILMPNLYGDILSDAAGGLIGGLGLASSGCYGENYAYFESAHGTAPDIAGKNIINPTATMLSAAMMLDYLGFPEEAKRIERAIEKVYAEGLYLTPDQGGHSSTTDFASAVTDHL